MPLRPFPLPISVGTDIARVARIREIILKDNTRPQNLVRFVRKVLTRRERLLFWERYGDYDLQNHGGLNAITRHLAGRWAAKEATIKAVLWRKLTFHDVVIRTPIHGEPMSAVILDRQSPNERPLQHEVNILNQPVEPKEHRAQDKYQQWDWPSTKTADHTDAPATKQSSPESEARQVFDSALDLEADEEKELSGQISKISISHDGDYAIATCLAVEEPLPGDVGGEAAARGEMP